MDEAAAVPGARAERGAASGVSTRAPPPGANSATVVTSEKAIQDDPQFAPEHRQGFKVPTLPTL